MVKVALGPGAVEDDDGVAAVVGLEEKRLSSADMRVPSPSRPVSMDHEAGCDMGCVCVSSSSPSSSLSSSLWSRAPAPAWLPLRALLSSSSSIRMRVWGRALPATAALPTSPSSSSSSLSSEWTKRRCLCTLAAAPALVGLAASALLPAGTAPLRAPVLSAMYSSESCENNPPPPPIPDATTLDRALFHRKGVKK